MQATSTAGGHDYSQRDWHHPDYEPIAESVAEKAKGAPYFKLKEGCTQRAGDNHGKYIEYMHNTVLELMEKYGKIDILWWDASWYKGMYTEEMWRSFELEQKVRGYRSATRASTSVRPTARRKRAMTPPLL
ncbi:MAG: alpha-L-fucosidase [Clostridia bacterium]|nr:alpha-L-fucosidase [Clostridia bacterium]